MTPQQVLRSRQVLDEQGLDRVALRDYRDKKIRSKKDIFIAIGYCNYPSNSKFQFSLSGRESKARVFFTSTMSSPRFPSFCLQ